MVYWKDPSFKDFTVKSLIASSKKGKRLQVEDHLTYYNDQPDGYFNCSIRVTYYSKIKNHNGLRYKLIGYSGKRTFTCTENHVQVCGLCACVDDDRLDNDDTCIPPMTADAFNDEITIRNLEIRVKSSATSSLTVPLTLKDDFYPLNSELFEFASSMSNAADIYFAEMRLTKPMANLLTFAIYQLPAERSSRVSSMNTNVANEYLAAVIQYAPIRSDALNKTMLANSVIYEQIIGNIKNYSVDIIVFPEAGLTGLGNTESREEIRTYLIEIPDPKDRVIPYLDEKYNHPILERLSYAAKENNVYVVINLWEIDYCLSNETACPSDGAFYYNTNIVFDREGAIVARYRKINLFCEPEFNYPNSTSDMFVFKTDFGVTFAMFVCFDIMFSQASVDVVKRYNVTDVIYSTAWFSEYPLLTAVEIQSGWSYSMDVNLLASNAHVPNRSVTGSGIYGGVEGPLVVVGSSGDEGCCSSKVLISAVRNRKKSPCLLSPANDKMAYVLKQPNEFINKATAIARNNETYFIDPSFRNASKTTLNVTAVGRFVHNFVYLANGLDCKIEVSYEVWRRLSRDSNSADDKDNALIHHKLYGYSGNRSFSCTENTVEMCGISVCSDVDKELCLYPGHRISSNVTLLAVTIQANSMNVRSIPVPITLINGDMIPLNSTYYRFNSQLINMNGTDLYISRLELTEPLSNVLTLAIYKLPFQKSVRESHFRNYTVN